MCVCVGGDQSFQGSKVSRSKTENLPDLAHYFLEGPDLTKKNRTKYFSVSKTFKVFETFRPNFQGSKVTLSKTGKSPDLTTFFETGPFSKHMGSPRSPKGIDIFGPGGMVPHSPPRFLQPRSEPKSGQTKKDSVFGRSNFSHLTFELRKMPNF